MANKIDATAPKLRFTTPTNNKKLVDTNSDLTFTFSEKIKAGTGNVILTDNLGNELKIPVSSSEVTISGTKLTVNPSNNLDYKTEYSVRFEEGAVTDLQNNLFGNTGDILSFTTQKDTDAPILKETTPLKDAPNVPVDSNVTFTFDEAIKLGTGSLTLKLGNKTLPKILISDDQISISGNTLTFNPTEDFNSESDYKISFPKGGITDLAGNTFGGTTFTFQTADITAPTLKSSPSNDKKVDVNSNLKFQFNENIKAGIGNVVLTDDLGNELKIPVSSSQVQINNATLTVNPSNNLDSNTAYTVRFEEGAVTDLQGNSFADTAAILSLTTKTLTDKVAPTLKGLSPLDNSTEVSVSSDLKLTFSETIKIGTSGNIVISNGTDTRTISVNDETQVSRELNVLTINPTDNLLPDSNYSIKLEAGIVTDKAGNNFAGITDATKFNFQTEIPAIIIDTLPPTINSVELSDSEIKVGDTPTVTFTFSESVTGFDGTDVTVANGSISTPTSTNGITWTATYMPTSDFEGTENVISVNSSGVLDAAQNAGTDSVVNSANYTIDTKSPTVEISLSDGVISANETSMVTFTFSEAVTDFTTADITAPNGTLADLTTTNGGLSWTATFTPTVETLAATNVITVNKVGVIDAAGNAGVSSTTSANYSVNTKIPTVTVALSDTAIKIGDTSVVTFTFSEPVAGFDSNDITVVNGTISTPSSSNNGVTWTAIYTPNTSVEDTTNVISVNKTGVTTVAVGNAGVSSTSSANYLIDTLRPTINSVVLSDSAIKVGDTPTVTFTFSESVTGFDGTDVTVANGSISTPTSTNGVTWTTTYTPTSDIENTTNLISVSSTNVFDTAQNAGANSVNSENYTIDTKSPTVAISLSDSVISANETSVVTFTFSEAVTDFTTADITAPNGTLADLATANGGLSWTATFTPTVETLAATNVITVNKAGVIDAVGNAGVSSTSSANYSVNTKIPTVTVALSDTAIKIGDTSMVTFTFSEAVAGFEVADVLVANGAISTPSSSDNGVTWTATYTPNANVEDTTNVISVNKTGVTTVAAGNAGVGSTSSVNYVIDTLAPIATVTSAAITNSGNANVTSSEAGTAYLVKSTVNVSNLASITEASGDAWNSASVTANSATNLSASGLVDGYYKVYTVDAAGNLSIASTDTITVATSLDTLDSLISSQAKPAEIGVGSLPRVLLDSASMPDFVIVNNFGDDDRLILSNMGANHAVVSSNATDVTLTINNNGIVSQITLVGVNTGVNSGVITSVGTFNALSVGDITFA